MYKSTLKSKGSMTFNKSVIGESIEVKFERILSNKEPIKDGAPLIYNERKDGVGSEYNIRTDRFELAVMGTDKINNSLMAKREEKMKLGEQKEDGETVDVNATESAN